MHSSFNTRITNSDQTTGNNAAYIESLRNLIQINDGTRSFIPRTVDCHDHNCPYGENDETRIDITHGDHMISNLSDGFLTFNITVYLKAMGINKDFKDPDRIFKLFVGFKDSNQILDKLQIYCNGKNTGYNQNECLREGFAYSVIKPKQEKRTKRFIHSPYENVQDYSPSVCGTYVDILDLADGQEHAVSFEVNLPFDDILALQAFDLFANSVIGEIELRYYVKHWGLVWCEVDPRRIKEYKEFMEAKEISSEFANNVSATFHHQFTQINNSADITANVSSEDKTIDEKTVKKMLTATKGEITLMCTHMEITSNKSNMFGHGITQASLQSIANTLSQGLIIPSQELEYNAFPIAATAAGIQSNINVPLHNTTCMSILFPKHNNDRTVFENPVYDNLQLIVDGKNFPDEVLNSTSARFLQYQLVASDLHRGIECTKEFEDSITMAKNDSSSVRYANTLSDGTSFMWNVQTERNNAGYCFDGLDTDGKNIQIQIRGQPIFSGINDTYYNVDSTGNKHPPPPQIWFCKDTYFIVSTDGMTYVNNNTPPQTQAQ